MPASRIHPKFRLIIIITSFILMLVISVLWFVLTRPATGKIVTSKSGSIVQQAAVSDTNTLAASHFSIAYDNQLETLSNVTAQNPGALEAYRVAGAQRILAITLRSGSYEEDSSYRLRQTHNDLYKESSASYNGKSYTIMKKADGSEVVAFISKDNKYAIVAYTVHNPLANLQREFDAMLTSFHWL